MGIPAAEAQVQTAHKGDVPIDETELLMMSPVQNHVIVHTIKSLQGVLGHLGETGGVERQVLKRTCDRGCQLLPVWQVIRMAENSNIGMQIFQMMFSVGRRDYQVMVSWELPHGWDRERTSQGLRHFLVNNHVDTHTSLGSGLEHSIESILLILGWRSSEIQLGGQPPCWIR